MESLAATPICFAMIHRRRAPSSPSSWSSPKVIELHRRRPSRRIHRLAPRVLSVDARRGRSGRAGRERSPSRSRRGPRAGRSSSDLTFCLLSLRVRGRDRVLGGDVACLSFDRLRHRLLQAAARHSLIPDLFGRRFVFRVRVGKSTARAREVRPDHRTRRDPAEALHPRASPSVRPANRISCATSSLPPASAVLHELVSVPCRHLGKVLRNIFLNRPNFAICFALRIEITRRATTILPPALTALSRSHRYRDVDSFARDFATSATALAASTPTSPSPTATSSSASLTGLLALFTRGRSARGGRPSRLRSSPRGGRLRARRSSRGGRSCSLLARVPANLHGAVARDAVARSVPLLVEAVRYALPAGAVAHVALLMCGRTLFFDWWCRCLFRRQRRQAQLARQTTPIRRSFLRQRAILNDFLYRPWRMEEAAMPLLTLRV